MSYHLPRGKLTGRSTGITLWAPAGGPTRRTALVSRPLMESRHETRSRRTPGRLAGHHHPCPRMGRGPVGPSPSPQRRARAWLGRALRRHRPRHLARPGRHRSGPERLGIQHRHRALRHVEDVRRHQGPALSRLHQAMGRRVRQRAGRARLGPGPHAQSRLHPAGHAGAVPLRAHGRPALQGGGEDRARGVRPASRRTPTAGYWHKGIYPERDVDRRHLHGRAVPRELRPALRRCRVRQRHGRVPGDARREALPRSEDRPALPRVGPGPERRVGRSEDRPLTDHLGPRHGLVRDGDGRHPRTVAAFAPRLPAPARSAEEERGRPREDAGPEDGPLVPGHGPARASRATGSKPRRAACSSTPFARPCG